MWYLAFPSLLFPYLYLINLFFLILWIIRRRWFLILPLIAFVLGLTRLPRVLQINPDEEKPVYVEGQSEAIHVMSFNVRLFDLYNWSHNNETRQKIFNLFEKEKPDILCMQEFYSSEEPIYDNITGLKEFLVANNYHVEFPITLRDRDNWGIATFSKYPIVEKGVLYFDKKTANICIFTDVQIQTDTVRIYNCHLQSIRFRDDDYKFFENLGQGEGELTRLKKSRRIVSRLKNAFIKRSTQADLIAAHIASCPYPVIVCGDFNDTPVSYTYQTISENLKDAFMESGVGLGSTYAGPLPGLRIDYLLYSGDFASYNFHTIRKELSDHYPISSMLILNPQ